MITYDRISFVPTSTREGKIRRWRVEWPGEQSRNDFDAKGLDEVVECRGLKKADAIWEGGMDIEVGLAEVYVQGHWNSDRSGINGRY